MNEIRIILLGVFMFTLIVLVLVSVILLARSRLVIRGSARILINGEPEHMLTVALGGKLMSALASHDVFLPSACSGAGMCGQCKVRVLQGGGAILPTERAKIDRRQARAGYRLSCQVPVKEDMSIEVPPEIFSVRKWQCRVRSNRNVASFIKELILDLPEGEQIDFRAGGYIIMEAPPHTVHFRDFVIMDEYRPDWDRHNLWRYVSKVDEPVMRAYSLANYPMENDFVMLNVRIATPPSSKPEAAPGKMSSYIFNLVPGDTVTISGPYGEFFAKETDNEMIFVGGGAGMAPMRSHIFDQLKRLASRRKMSFWYGARSLREAFYVDEFDMLAKEHDNFEWRLALSEPVPEDHWTGDTGFIHAVLYDCYLKDHPAPEDCEYYLCGPGPMISALTTMLDDLGVEPDSILYDDFGT